MTDAHSAQENTFSRHAQQRNDAGPKRLRVYLFVLPMTFSALTALIAYLQLFGVSRDYPEYNSFFTLTIDSLPAAFATRFEPGFVLLSYTFLTITASALATYALLAALSAFLKFAVVRAMAPPSATIIAALFYFFRFLPLHELTQLRAALAIAFLLAAFRLRYSDHIWLSAASCALAVSMHLSALFVAPLVLIRFARLWHIALLAGCEFAAAHFLLPSVVQWVGSSLQVIGMYESQSFGAPNPLSAGILLDLMAIAAGLLLWRDASPPMRHILVLQLVGVAFFYGASSAYPVFAHRTRELFSVFWTLYVALAFRGSRHLRLAFGLFVIASSLGYSYLYWFNPKDVYFH